MKERGYWINIKIVTKSLEQKQERESRDTVNKIIVYINIITKQGLLVVGTMFSKKQYSLTVLSKLNYNHQKTIL